MEEDYGQLIDDLTAAGASDEEITAILDERLKASQQAPSVPPPTAGEVGGHVAGTFNKVVTDVVPQTLRAAGIATTKAANLLASGTNALGLTDVAPQSVEENPLYQAGQKVEEWKSKNMDYIPDSRLADSFWATDIPAGLGSVAAVLASQGRSLFKDVALKTAAKAGTINAVKEAGKALTTRPVVTGGVMMSVPEYDAAIEAGLSEDQAFEVFLKNYLIGGTEAAPIERALSFINKVTGNRIMRTIKSGAVGSIEEALQEALQTYLANQVAAGTYDPERDPLDGVLRAALAGGVIGGGLAGAGGALSERRKRPTEAQALYEAEKSVVDDPTATTGDPAIDGAIDTEFADISAKLDEIEIEDKANVYDDEEKLESLVSDFNAIEEENELPVTPELTPQEAGAIQAAGPLPNQIEQEVMLDDAEATPALDQRVQELTPSINDENEIPSNIQEFTPQEATAIQSAQLPSQPVQETNLDDSESTPAIPPQTVPIGEQVATPERAVETRSVAEPVSPTEDPAVAAQKKEQAKVEKLRERVTKQLDKIQDLKPGARLRKLQELDEATLDYEDINQKVVKELEKERAVREDKAFTKAMKSVTPEEKLDILGARAGAQEDVTAVENIKKAIQSLESTDLDVVESAKAEFDIAADQITNSPNLLSVEQAEAIRIVKDIKTQFDKKLEPKIKAEKQVTASRSEQVKKDKDKYLTKIARSIQQGVPAMVVLDIKSYQEYRKSQGLAPVDEAKIRQQANAEYYVNKAKSQIKRDVLDERKRARETEAEIEEAARRAAQQDIRETFDLSEDTDISEIGGPLEPSVQGRVNLFSNIEKTTVDSLFKRIEASYLGNTKFLSSIRELFNISLRISKDATTTGLELYVADASEKAPRGFFATDYTNSRELLVISRTSEGSVDAHELIHFITSAVVHNIASKRGLSNAIDRFYTRAEDIFVDARKVYRDRLLTIARDLNAGDTLSQNDQTLIALIQGYLENDSKLSEYANGPLTAAQVRELYDNTFKEVNGHPKGRLSYFLNNSDEMLAETFSNPYAMGIMSMLKSNKQVNGENISFFRTLLDGLKTALDSIVKKLNIKFNPVKNNYLEEITNFMEEMEATYITETREDKTRVPLITNLVRGATKLLAQFHAMAPLAGKKLPKKFMPIVNMTANRIWKRTDIKSEADVQNVVDKINSGTKTNKLGPEATKLIWTKIEKYRGTWADAKQIQINARDYGQTLPEYKDSLPFKKDLDDFASIDLDELSVEQIKDVENGILDLVTNGIPSQKAYNIANKARAIAGLKELLPTAGKYAKTTEFKVPLLGAVDAKMIGNSATFATLLSKYNKPVAQKLFKVMYGGMMSAKTESQKRALAFTEKLYNIADKYNLDQSDYTRAHMYGVAFTTKVPDNSPLYWQEVEDNLNTIIENSRNKVFAVENKVYNDITLKTAQDEVKTAEGLKEVILKRKSMDNILTTGQQLLYDEFRAFNKQYERDIIRNAKGVWGDNTFVYHYNYIPTIALGRAKTGDIKADKLIYNPHADNLWEALQTGQDFGNLRSKQQGNTKERISPKGYFYDYNLMSVANKYAPTILFDVYGTRDLKALNQLLNGAQGKPVVFEGKNIRSVLPPRAIDGLNYQLKNIVGYGRPQDAEVGKIFKRIAQTKDTIQTALLATGGQFIVQASSAVPASLIMHPKGFAKAMKVLTGFEKGVLNFSNMREFIQENGLSIQLRDVLFERFQTVEDVQAAGLPRYAHKISAKLESAATKMLRSGDKFAARLVWFSAFFQEGGTLEKPTVDAVLAAERAVGILQNMSDISFAAPIFKANSPQHRMLIHMFFAFKSFAFNAAVNTYGSMRHLHTSGEARRVFLSNLSMAAAYHVGALYLIKPLYSTVADWLSGDDDDEEEKNYSDAKYLAVNTFWDMFIGQASPGVIDSVLRWATGEISKTIAKSEGEPFDPVMDSALYVPRNYKDAISELAGPYGDLLEGYFDIAIIMAKITGESLDLLEESPEEARKLMYYQLLRDLALLTKIIPFRGDVQKLLREKIKDQRKEISNTGGSSEGDGAFEGDAGTEFDTIGDTETETEFEF